MAGRPKRSGVIWTDFAQREVWVGVEFVKWRDEHKDTRQAIDSMLRAGWSVVVCDTPMTVNPETGYAMPDPSRKQSNKFWGPYVDMARRDEFSRRVITECEPPGQQDQPVETLRKKYYDVSRRYSSDAQFQAECDRELQSRKDRHGG